MRKTEIKPCPCCGKEAKYDTMQDIFGVMCSIQCQNKLCCLMVSRHIRPGRTEKQAKRECIKAWNKRMAIPVFFEWENP